MRARDIAINLRQQHRAGAAFGLMQVNLSVVPPPKQMNVPLKRIQILPTAPLLTATPSGDELELRPGGSWTAANVTTLEALSNAVTAQLDRARTVKVDMAEVRE